MRRDEHEQRAAAFRKQLAAEAVKPRDQQQWPTTDEWPAIEATAICRTPHCPVQDQPFPVRLHENADGQYRATCGRCGQPHTDLAARFDDTGPVNLAPPRPTDTPPRRREPSPEAPAGVEERPAAETSQERP